MADIDTMLQQLEGVQPSGPAGDQENARRVLESLEVLGDLRPNERAELERLRATAPVNQRAIGETGAAYRGALQGATFQQADEVLGLFGGDKQAARDANRLAQERYPGAYGTGKTAGAIMTGVGTGVATAPLAVGRTALGAMARGAVLGGAEGALWGSGGAEEGEKAQEALKYGQIGAGLGAAVPGAVHVASRGLGAADDLVRGVLNRGNEARANRAALETLRKSGRNLDDVADDVALAARQGQPEFRMMDALGTAGARRASGIARAGDDGAEEIAQFLRLRQLDQGDRLGGFIDDAFQTKGTTAAKTKADLTAKRGEVADVMYSAARENAKPVDTRPAIGVIDQRIGGMKGSNISGDGIDAKLARFRDRLRADPAPDGELSRELSDFDRVLGVKQDVQDAVGAALRGGRNNEARELGKLVKQLDQALERSSDAYRLANDSFRAASQVIDSVDEGAKMATRGRGADNVSAIQGMTPDQRRATAVGYGDARLNQLERNASPTANKAKPFSTTKAQAETNALATDPALFDQRIARENTMWETQNRAMGGSRTADNLADIESTGFAADVMRAGQELASGNAGNALTRAGGAAARLASGQNEATRKLVADILMSPDPKKAMSAALSTERNAEKRRWIAQAVARALSRRTTDSATR
ncbi:MAG: hypothetical protein ACRBB0_15220 [Pelagimonas sp.]|uniref:hypothetical protein n=1 Tax=Pelagimonas sp. TaxID=2073170 RepID=UPI003D6C4CCD